MEITREDFDQLQQSITANSVMLATLLTALRGKDIIQDITIDAIEVSVLKSAQSFDMPYMVNQCQMVMDLTRPVIESLKNQGHIV
ncbi:MAG: hypothetical protein PQJ59_07555 [Spirochaetales bacterium]|nr:hypothetical protein [Spirochaetales bacterium]